MASALISRFTKPDQVIYDPFSGCGTVALEAWIARRHVVANDLSPYAYLLSRAKLSPPRSQHSAQVQLQNAALRVRNQTRRGSTRIPRWVKRFFHPKTLREALIWRDVLSESGNDFLLACLLGILHHQRPGFLSYPSSHAVPYLRAERFPSHEHPELYRYRPVLPRLEAKLGRAFKRVPQLNYGLKRRCLCRDASSFLPDCPVDAIITSPPYMRQLDYGRDNRLRLWFLGSTDTDALDSQISPSEEQFLSLMTTCLKSWKSILRKNAYCVLILGDTRSRIYQTPLPQVIASLATEIVGGYHIHGSYTEIIPVDRRVRRGCRGSLSETILVLRNR